jgi:hypothetical protein
MSSSLLYIERGMLEERKKELKQLSIMKPSSLKHVHFDMMFTAQAGDCEKLDRLIRFILKKKDIQVHVARV